MPWQAGVMVRGCPSLSHLLWHRPGFTSWGNGTLDQLDDSIDWMVRPTPNVLPYRAAQSPSTSPPLSGGVPPPFNPTLGGQGIHHSIPKHHPQEPEPPQDKMNQDTATKSHPLGPLTGTEIIQASDLIKAHWDKTALQFKVITLQEPVKTELIPYLAAERAGEPTPSIDRRAFVVYYFRGTVGSPPPLTLLVLTLATPCSISSTKPL